MATPLTAEVESYLRAKTFSRGTRNEYHSTVRKWQQWGNGVPIEELSRKNIREFLDWVHERAVAGDGTNPNRTANKAREQLRAVLSWAWEQELIDAPPRFPKAREQRDVAGRHYLTKTEINSLYFATHSMPRPRGWNCPIPVGRYWRSAIVEFFYYGVDTGTVWKSAPFHEPILWRHVSWGRHSPDRLQDDAVPGNASRREPSANRDNGAPLARPAIRKRKSLRLLRTGWASISEARKWRGGDRGVRSDRQSSLLACLPAERSPGHKVSADQGAAVHCAAARSAQFSQQAT
jgi:hypothetical protein